MELSRGGGGDLDGLTHQIIAAALEVHSVFGPGLLESIYEKCLTHELVLRRLRCETQKSVPLSYKGIRFAEGLRFDLLVSSTVLVEVKTVDGLLPIHQAQLLSYMKILKVPVGLLINFNELHLRNGIKRLINPSASIGVYRFKPESLVP